MMKYETIRCYVQGWDTIVRKVPRPKGPNDTPLSVNIPGEWSEEVERLVETMTEPGMAVTRSDIIRMALRRGLDALKTEHPETKRRRGG
jgi:hypothetical protein